MVVLRQEVYYTEARLVVGSFHTCSSADLLDCLDYSTVAPVEEMMCYIVFVLPVLWLVLLKTQDCFVYQRHRERTVQEPDLLLCGNRVQKHSLMDNDLHASSLWPSV